MTFRMLSASIFLLVTASGCAQIAAVPENLHANPWWRGAVVYEIYPRSFQDSNGDGVGDLNGIRQRLDYLERLGVDAIWLTPIYPSPQVDFGYDISDYTAIDPRYGTMADFDRLVREAAKHHIRVLMDLVLNHTSDKHPWFIESASSRTNPKRDWYIWRDGVRRSGGRLEPPNNWVNRIDQSAWRFDPATGQYGYHYYAPEQPDLNWRNPAVEAAMLEAAKFWLNRGVAGFRLDAINTLYEDAAFRDEPQIPGTNEYGEPSLSQVYQRNLPEVHDVLRDLRRVSDGYHDERVLIGEIYTQSTAEMATWYGKSDDELQLPMDTNVGFLNRLDAAGFRKLLDEAAALGTDKTPLFVFDNHDRPRSWDRYGDGKHNLEIAKMLAAILLGTHSTSLIYQGEELEMETAVPTRKEDVRDPRGLAGWPQEKGRDGERTPMQWDRGQNAGFSSAAKTWLPVENSFTTKNVATESTDPRSLLNWYQGLIALKRTNSAFHDGRTLLFNYDSRKVLLWVTEGRSGGAVLVACNMSGEPVSAKLDQVAEHLKVGNVSLRTIMSSTTSKHTENSQGMTLAAFETLIGEVARR